MESKVSIYMYLLKLSSYLLHPNPIDHLSLQYWNIKSS